MSSLQAARVSSKHATQLQDLLRLEDLLDHLVDDGTCCKGQLPSLQEEVGQQLSPLQPALSVNITVKHKSLTVGKRVDSRK